MKSLFIYLFFIHDRVPLDSPQSYFFTLVISQQVDIALLSHNHRSSIAGCYHRYGDILTVQG